MTEKTSTPTPETTAMTTRRTIEQNAADLEIARMRMDQARDRLADAIIAGQSNTVRLEKVHAAAIWDCKDLMAERRYFQRVSVYA
jgi:demethoxyubiquinone hydroxylase (CLK1/Coq7/Cat5 family)